MKDKRVKTFITQRIILFTGLIAVLVALLIDLMVKISAKEYEEVDTALVDMAEDYALRFNETIEALTEALTPMANLLGTYSDATNDLAKNVAISIVENVEAYQVVLCDSYGRGITQTGEIVHLGTTEYFKEVSPSIQKYIVSGDDEITGKACIISVVPITNEYKTKGFLLAYYDKTNFEKLIRNRNFDPSSYYVVVDQNNQIVCNFDVEKRENDSVDFWENFSGFTNSIEELENSRAYFNQYLSGTMKLEGREGKKAKELVFAPVGVNGWKLVIVLNYSRVKMLHGQEWLDTRNMLIRLIICIPLFLGVLVTLDIVYKYKEAEKRKNLTEKAETDLLTGLNNKAATEWKITSHLLDHPNEQGILFLFDVDNFKKINDTMGHAFGDEVLRSIGHHLPSNFRVTDIVGRIGGDEFMIFLKGITDDDVIQKEARKMELFFKNFQVGEYVKYSPTASIGAAVYPRDAKDFESLYKVADKALYTAKQRGKNQLAFYNADLDQKRSRQ